MESINKSYDGIELILLEMTNRLCFWPVLNWKKRVYRIRAERKYDYKSRVIYVDKDLKSWLDDMDIDYELNMKYKEDILK